MIKLSQNHRSTEFTFFVFAIISTICYHVYPVEGEDFLQTVPPETQAHIAKTIACLDELRKVQHSPVMDKKSAAKVNYDTIKQFHINVDPSNYPEIVEKLETTRIPFSHGEKAFYPNPIQAEIICSVLSDPSAVIIVEGVPGSGKTSNVLKYLVGFFETQTPKPTIFASAPNKGGMAALKKDFAEMQRIHYALEFEELLERTEDDVVVIIDECYQMNLEQFAQLLDVTIKNHWRLILSGDPNQITPDVSIYGFLGSFKTHVLLQTMRTKWPEERLFPEEYLQNGISNGLTFFTYFQSDEQEAKGINGENDPLLSTSEDIMQEITDKRGKFVSVLPNKHQFVTRWIQSKIALPKITPKNIALICHQSQLPSSLTGFHDACTNDAQEVTIKGKTIKLGNGSLIKFVDKKTMKERCGTVKMIDPESHLISITWDGSSTPEEFYFESKYGKRRAGKTTFPDGEISYNYNVYCPAASQGITVDYAVVILHPKLTASELYVALTRHKKGVLIVVPISKTKTPSTFKNINEAIHWLYPIPQEMWYIKIQTLKRIIEHVKKQNKQKTAVKKKLIKKLIKDIKNCEQEIKKQTFKPLNTESPEIAN